MAKEKKEKKEKKITLERIYSVPLRKKFLRVAKYKRTPKAVKTLQEFIEQHMKSTNVKIGRHLNMKIWGHGIKNPPHHVKIVAKKYDDGSVFAELEGAPVEKPVEVKKPVKKEKAEEPSEKKEISEKAKEIEKEEIAELKKEHPKQHAPKDVKSQTNVETAHTFPSGRNEMTKP